MTSKPSEPRRSTEDVPYDLIVLAVDPGGSGGYAALDLSLTVLGVGRNSSPGAMGLVAEYEPGVIVLESVTANATGSKVSAFTFGRSFGWWEGLAHALGRDVEYITPKVWKKEVGIPPGSTKRASVDALLGCGVFLPKDVFAKVRSKSKLGYHDGIVEAILIGVAWISRRLREPQ